MDNNDDLNSVEKNNFKYLFVLIYFFVIYSAFLTYEIHYLYHLVFILSILIMILSFERLERELLSVKMKNHYIKAKLSLQIEELEKSIIKNRDEFSRKVLQDILEEIKL